MSDDQEQEGTESGGALRKQLEAALEKAKEAEARAAAAETAITDQKLTTFLSGKQIPTKVAKFIKADGVDVNDDAALNAWLADNADVFGGVKVDEEQAETTPHPEADAWRQAQAATAAGGQSSYKSKFDQTLQAIPVDASPAEVRAAILAAGF